MKLTDAVQIGRTILNPKQGNDLFDPEDGCTKYGGCYRGMAVVGAGLVKLPVIDDGWADQDESGYNLTHSLEHGWPWTVIQKVRYPCACKDLASKSNDKMTIDHMMAHLWDDHIATFGPEAEPHTEALDDPWTFERITDWLRSIEPPEDPATPPQV